MIVKECCISRTSAGPPLGGCLPGSDEGARWSGSLYWARTEELRHHTSCGVYHLRDIKL